MKQLHRLILVSALLGCSALTAMSSVASAADFHVPLFDLAEVPTEGPFGEAIAIPGPALNNMNSMTVDSGRVWVAEGFVDKRSRIDVWNAKTGAFIAQPVHLEGAETEGKLPTCFGEGCGEGIAVGHGPGEASVYVAGEKHGVSVVSVYNEAGALKAAWNGAATPAGTFGISEQTGSPNEGSVTDVAVDNSTSPSDAGRGDVFVAMRPGKAIDVFHPESNGEEHYVGQITGPSPSEPFKYASRMVVDEASGDLFVIDTGSQTIDVFEPTAPGAYTFVRKLTGSPGNPFKAIYTLGVDSATGELYVNEFTAKSNWRLDQFSVTGSYLGHTDEIPDAFSIAVDPESHYLYMRNVVYGPNVVIPDVVTSPPASLKPESAVLAGTVNPDNEGNATCQFVWGTTPAFGHAVPCSTSEIEGGSPVPVQAELNNLERGVTYYYRLQSTNKNGTNPGEEWQTESFRTPGAIVRNASVVNVSADSAMLEATIDPNGQATSYYFQYGPTNSYGQRVPVSQEAIGPGVTDVEVPGKLVQGLEAGTEYHYRVVAVSEAKPGELETLYGEDQTFTTQPASGATSLLDGRQWELVTPPNKYGAEIQSLGEGAIQASAAGDAFAYRANTPSETEPQGYSRIETALSTRHADGWSSLDISPPHNQAGGSLGLAGEEFRVFSTDLSQAMTVPISSEFTPLSSEATETTPYLRSDFPSGDAEALCTSSCYKALVSASNTPAGTVFGEEPKGYCVGIECGPRFEGASPDLTHVVISSPAQLTETPAPSGGPGVYEWSAGRLELLDRLPKGEEGPAVLAGLANEQVGPRHAISDNGSRVILQDGEPNHITGLYPGGLYLHETGAGEAKRLDVVQGGTGPSAGLRYETASKDASRIFFIDDGELTSQHSTGGEDLYEYDVNTPAGKPLSDLTVDSNTGEAAEVVGVFGASEDGSYVYFLAKGVLAPGAQADHLNVYVRHEGVTTLIATTPGIESWLDIPGSRGRVSPDGHWLAFVSSSDLTGYDTRDASSHEADAEVYLYGSESGKLTCVSCDPTGARPDGILLHSYYVAGSGVQGEAGAWTAASVPAWDTIISSAKLVGGTFYQPRYLSDGGRVFFNSADTLVPQDVNGTEDVYEYEPPGVGNCSPASPTFAPRSGGCVDLVSSGTSPAESAFLDASETGGDVFFLTQARLLSQDYDTAYDIYDARECTTSTPCYPVQAPQPSACETEASCRMAPSPQPALYGAPASATFSGIGNVPPTAPATKPLPPRSLTPAQKLARALKACRKGRKRSRRLACEKRARRLFGKKARKAQRARMLSTKAAKANRRGGK